MNEMRGTTGHFVASRRCSFRQRTHRLDLRHQRVVARAGVGGRHGGGPEQTLALGCGLHAFAVLPRRASRARARRRDGNRRQHERRSHGRRGGRAPARRVASRARHPLAVHAQGLLVEAVDAPGHSNEVPQEPLDTQRPPSSKDATLARFQGRLTVSPTTPWCDVRTARQRTRGTLRVGEGPLSGNLLSLLSPSFRFAVSYDLTLSIHQVTLIIKVRTLRFQNAR